MNVFKAVLTLFLTVENQMLLRCPPQQPAAWGPGAEAFHRHRHRHHQRARQEFAGTGRQD